MFNPEAIKNLFMKEGTASEEILVNIYQLGFEKNGPKWTGKLKDLDKIKTIGEAVASDWSIVKIYRADFHIGKEDEIPMDYRGINIIVV